MLPSIPSKHIILFLSLLFLFYFSISVAGIENEIQSRADDICTTTEYQNKYQNYIETLRKKVKVEKVELERREQIKLELSRVDALKNLTFGLLDIFDKIIDEHGIDDSLSQPDFQKVILKLISAFHHTALKMNDTAFLEQIWNQYQKHNKNDTVGFFHKVHSSKENIASEMVDNVLHGVSDSADILEENMHRHNFGGNSKLRGSLETVIKLEEEDYISDNKHDLDNGEEPRRRGHVKVITIVDADNNEYVLTRPNDLTMFYEDARLVQDLIFLIVAAFIFGWTFNSFGLPAFLGYIIAGAILGPAGYNVIQELIQTETLSQFGVVFIVFMLGLEFSFDKIRSIWRFALGSASLIFTATLSFFILAGFIVGASVNESIFIGACVSLSSTAVVERLQCSELKPLYGLLVMQDMLFGVLLAALPALSKSGIDVVLAIGRLILSLVIFTTFSLAIANIPIGWLLKVVKGSENHELFLLGSISMCLLMSQVSLMLGLGVEIGCFVAGVLIHNRKSIFESSKNVVIPVRDIFSCLFFACIGLHVYPSFLINEGPLLFTLTAGAIGFKFITSTISLTLLGHSLQKASKMAIGLSQISEFAFVLGSKAKGFGIISREVYYLLLTTTSLSLMVTPILWNILFRNRKVVSNVEGGLNVRNVDPLIITM
ncbi:16133_t:CDS:2 [Funneliformis geosporum]|uniref:2556_t:CDS:1 n=1 Tax=Funneliformis geosporum TaxID=1117311 RepID=A0A9W4SV22_9GLOM|nr:16133_t:CDS:2 [Funneliformis geosporum]CAI2181717.1 2556_t:CDS:2 [Funneliformis geosporum]